MGKNTPAVATTLHRQVVRIIRVDEARHVIYGMVYEPNVLDTYGEFMVSEDVESLCHRFAQLSLGETIDTMHDNIPNGSYPVESFIARDGDSDFPAGAWVLGVKVTDGHLWAQIKKGELNGFSFEALVKPVDVRVKVDVVRDLVGRTEPGGLDDHMHVYFVQTNDRGAVVRGFSSREMGHTHDIRRASTTEPGGSNRHQHRFFITG